MLVLLLMLAAFLFLLMAAFSVAMPRFHAGWLGLALWVLANILTRWKF